MHAQNLSSTIAALFVIRDKAHLLHLKTKSFAQHVALGEFYDKLLALTDDLAETYMGKYPLDTVQDAGGRNFESTMDAKTFIQQIAAWLEVEKQKISPEDSFLMNIWDEITATAFKAKYKLENLG